MNVVQRILRGRAAEGLRCRQHRCRPRSGLGSAYSLPQLFPTKVPADLTDVADYLGKKYGGWRPIAAAKKKTVMLGDKWLAIPQGAPPVGYMDYRGSDEEGRASKFPKDLPGSSNCARA